MTVNKGDKVIATHHRLLSYEGKQVVLVRKKFETPLAGVVIGRPWYLTRDTLVDVWLVEPLKGSFYRQPLICLPDDMTEL
jgi:hypothetical protein